MLQALLRGQHDSALTIATLFDASAAAYKSTRCQTKDPWYKPNTLTLTIHSRPSSPFPFSSRPSLPLLRSLKGSLPDATAGNRCHAMNAGSRGVQISDVRTPKFGQLSNKIRRCKCNWKFYYYSVTASVLLSRCFRFFQIRDFFCHVRHAFVSNSTSYRPLFCTPLQRCANILLLGETI